ncbi:predicted protein [Naegleria gruberi]|uniref:Predicted protein n=1 Tax=Naegleria gruberi TaxID=5762 RepID=D2UZF2_NAEGR|nr:uncharacterized protein NAEGRDRAFT_61915 [Naegleria gruberi]EFC49939.1 predicted protein [Naegleria gruberi]|eukprot:XP_002682683.1 predicted protein [Naegleria gruberi strain NEG-M]
MVCSGHGTCIANNHCSCRPGYGGEQCQEISCFNNYPRMVQCSNHGECIALDTCTCYDLYTGPNCEQCKQPFHEGEHCTPIQCFGVEYSVKSVCSGNGDCIASNNCSCRDGFVGERCEQFTCLNSTLNNTESNNSVLIPCSGHGECVKANNTCNCYSDVLYGFWAGANCDSCKSGYGGTECKEQVCSSLTTCNGRGECTQHNEPKNNVKYFFAGYQLISRSAIRAQNFRNLTLEGSIATEGGFSVQVLRSAYGQVNVRNDISKNMVNSAISLYQEFSSLDCDQTMQQSIPSGGLNLKAGTYCFPQGLNGGGKISVSGSGRIVLILKTNLNYGFTVEYLDGATVDNLFWVVAMGSSISGKFSGNLLTVGQINVNNAFISGSIINVGSSEMNLNGASFGPIYSPPVVDPCKCFGNYAPPYCESCSAGFFGDNCTLSCSPERNCNGRGQCSQTGSCLCGPRFSGAYCEVCATKWIGKNCDYLIGDRAMLKISKLTIQYANPSKSTQIDCSSILLDETVKELGSSPQCYWDDKSTNSFVIDLGFGNTIYAGSILKFKLENGNSALVTVYTDPNSTNNPPTPILKVSSKISTCARLELDTSSSYSPDKKSISYKFEVTSTPNENSMVVLRRELSLFENQAFFNIAASKLAVGSYSIKLTVSSPVTGSASTQVTFEIIPVPPPIIDIPGGLSQSFVYGSVVVINPQISVAGCSNNDGSIIYSPAKYQDFSYNWEQVSGNATKFSQESYNRILVISSLQNEGSFKLSVSSSTGYSDRVTVELKLKESELVLKIRNGNFLYGKVNQAMTVDFSQSYDPTKTLEKEEFSIVCIPLGVLAVCPISEIYANVNQEKMFTIAENSLVAGLYQFTISYSKGRRSKTETVVVELAEYVFLNVFIKMATNDFLPTSVPLGMNVSLEAVSPPDIRNEVTYIWSSRTSGFTLNDQTTISGITGPFLTIRGEVLQPDTFYTIRLDAQWNKLNGFSEYYLAINTPPKPGYFTVNPLQSKSGIDTVTLSCSGWSDDNTPLSYQFFFNDAKTSSWQALTGKVSTNQVNVMLPPGYGSSSQLTIKARVYDSTGAFSEMQQVVMSS